MSFDNFSQICIDKFIDNACFNYLDDRSKQTLKSIGLIGGDINLMVLRVNITSEYLLFVMKQENTDSIIINGIKKLFNTFFNKMFSNIEKAYREIKKIESKTNHDVIAAIYYLKNFIELLSHQEILDNLNELKNQSNQLDVYILDKLKEIMIIYDFELNDILNCVSPMLSEYDTINLHEKLNKCVNLIHIFLTSEDISNLSHSYMVRNNVAKTNLLYETLYQHLMKFIIIYKDVIYMGRTHCQPAAGVSLAKIFMCLGYNMSIVSNWYNPMTKMGGFIGNETSREIIQNTNGSNDQKLFQKFSSLYGFSNHLITTQTSNHSDYLIICNFISNCANYLMQFSENVKTMEYSDKFFGDIMGKDSNSSSANPSKNNLWQSEAGIGSLNTLLNMVSRLPSSIDQRTLSDHTIEKNLYTYQGENAIAIDYLNQGFERLTIDYSKIIPELFTNVNAHMSEVLNQFFKYYEQTDGHKLIGSVTKGVSGDNGLNKLVNFLLTYDYTNHDTIVHISNYLSNPYDIKNLGTIDTQYNEFFELLKYKSIGMPIKREQIWIVNSSILENDSAIIFLDRIFTYSNTKIYIIGDYTIPIELNCYAQNIFIIEPIDNYIDKILNKHALVLANNLTNPLIIVLSNDFNIGDFDIVYNKYNSQFDFAYFNINHENYNNFTNCTIGTNIQNLNILINIHYSSLSMFNDNFINKIRHHNMMMIPTNQYYHNQIKFNALICKSFEHKINIDSQYKIIYDLHYNFYIVKIKLLILKQYLEQKNIGQNQILKNIQIFAQQFNIEIDVLINHDKYIEYVENLKSQFNNIVIKNNEQMYNTFANFNIH